MNNIVNAITIFIVLTCLLLVFFLKGVDVTYIENGRKKTEHMSWSELITKLEV